MFPRDNLMGDFEDPDTSSFNNEIKCLGSGIILRKADDTHASNLLTWVGSSSLGVSNLTKWPSDHRIQGSMKRVVEDSNEVHPNTTDVGNILDSNSNI